MPFPSLDPFVPHSTRAHLQLQIRSVFKTHFRHFTSSLTSLPPLLFFCLVDTQPLPINIRLNKKSSPNHVSPRVHKLSRNNQNSPRGHIFPPAHFSTLPKLERRAETAKYCGGVLWEKQSSHSWNIRKPYIPSVVSTVGLESNG